MEISDFEKTLYNCTGYVIPFITQFSLFQIKSSRCKKTLDMRCRLSRFFSPFKEIYFVLTGNWLSSTHRVLTFYLLSRKQPFQCFENQQNTKRVLNIKLELHFPQGKWDANEPLVVVLNTDTLYASELFCCQLTLTTEKEMSVS